MTDTLNDKTCLNLESKSIKPDVRVAYTEGLVLGVDEFVQEQHYLLEKDYLHNRGLHGYGTVYGLALSVAKSERETDTGNEAGQTPKLRSVTLDGNDKAWIRVGAGVGVDQRGRTFVLRQPYCVNLSDWFDALTVKPQPVPATEETPAYYPIYVRARYDETCGDLTTLAGQACSSDDLTSANSRIYDSVMLTLDTTIPVMSAWDLARRFAWLMSQIRVVPGIEFDTIAADALLTYVRQWLAVNDAYEKQFSLELDKLVKRNKPRYFQLPESNTKTQDLLEALRLAYVTDVAPKAHLTDAYEMPKPDAANDILLGQINLVQDGDNDKVHTVKLVEDERPYLLGTQTFQELASIGKRDKNRRRLFASLHVKSSTSLLLWLYHQNITLPDDLGVLGGNKVFLKSDADLKGKIKKLSNGFYAITVDDANAISLGSPVELTFKLNYLTDNANPSHPLELDNFNEYVGLNDNGNEITIYTFADNLAAVRSLANVTVRRDESDALVMDVGFYIGDTAAFAAVNAWQIFTGTNSTLLDPNTIVPHADANPRLLHLTLPDSVKDGDLLTLRLDTHNIRIGNDQLSTLMSNSQYTLAGYDGKQYVNLPCVVNAPVMYNDSDVEKVLKKNIQTYLNPLEQKLNTLRTLPFATITPVNDDNKLKFEIWLHTSLVANANGGVLSPLTKDDLSPLTKENLEIYLEQSNATAPILIEFDDPVVPVAECNNGFLVTPKITDRLPAVLKYLRFVFAPEKIMLSGGKTSVKKFMTDNNIKFDGNYISSGTNPNAIVVYVRNSVPTPEEFNEVGVVRNPAKEQIEVEAPPPVINALAEPAPKAAPKAAAPKPRTRRSGGKS